MELRENTSTRLVQLFHLDKLAFVVMALFSGLALYAAFFTDSQLHDFGNLWISADALKEGLNPYAVYPGVSVTDVSWGTIASVNLNPPPAFFLIRWFAEVPAATGIMFWRLINICAIGLSLFLLARHYPKMRPMLIAWLLLWPVVTNTITVGQIYGVLALLTTIAWIDLSGERAIRAGLLIGLAAAFKPFLLVWVALLLLARYGRAALTAGATFLALNLMALLVYGPEIYTQWLAVITDRSVHIKMPINISFVAPFFHAGLPLAGLIFAGLILAGLAVWAWFKKPGPEPLSTMAIIGALACSPLAWHYYLIFALPVFFWLRWTPLMVAGIVALSFPRIFIMLAIFERIELPALLYYLYPIGFALIVADVMIKLLQAEHTSFTPHPTSGQTA